MMEILCPILLVLVGLGVSSVSFNRDSPTKTMNTSLFERAQAPKVNTLTLNGVNIIDTNFLKAYNTNNITYQFVEWKDYSDNTTRSILEYNRYLQFLSTNITEYGNFFFPKVNQVTNEYEFILISNTYANDAPPIYVQEMLTNLIRLSSNNPKVAIQVNIYELLLIINFHFSLIIRHSQ